MRARATQPCARTHPGCASSCRAASACFQQPVAIKPPSSLPLPSPTRALTARAGFPSRSCFMPARLGCSVHAPAATLPPPRPPPHAGGVLAVGLGTASEGLVAFFESRMHVTAALAANATPGKRSPWLQPVIVGEWVVGGSRWGCFSPGCTGRCSFPAHPWAPTSRAPASPHSSMYTDPHHQSPYPPSLTHAQTRTCTHPQAPLPCWACFPSHTHSHTHAHSHTRTPTPTHTHTHTPTHARTHARTHTHTHTQAPWPSWACCSSRRAQSGPRGTPLSPPAWLHAGAGGGRLGWAARGAGMCVCAEAGLCGRVVLAPSRDVPHGTSRLGRPTT